MFVGDVIMSAREACPDLPGTLPAPGPEIVFFPQAGANPLPPGAYYLQATYGNLWGETTPGPEVQLTVVSGQTIFVLIGSSRFLNAITFINVYVGSTAGGEIQQYNFTGPFTTSSTLQITSASTLDIVTPPQGNSAFLPDSGGPVASASQVFRWLQDALNRLSSLNGGIPDFGGFATVNGQSQFTVPGDWQTINDAWYDGYPMFVGSSSLVFRRNTIPALSGMVSQSQVADTLVVELFAQPIRTAGWGTLSVAIDQTTNFAQAANLTGWVLPFGLLMFGNPAARPANFEIAAYTGQGSNFANMVRGLGGTNAQAWPMGTLVSELNVMWKGLRAAQLYSPGMASWTLRLPSSWVPLMHMYLLGRYRQIEQNQSEADGLFKAFEAGAAQATKKKPAVGDRQIQPLDNVAVDVYPLLSRTFGGGIVP